MEKTILKTTHISMESHLAMDDCNYSVNSCVILNESHILKGKKIIISNATPKKEGVFGKSTTKYYLEDSDKLFDSLDAFCNEYGFVIKKNHNE